MTGLAIPRRAVGIVSALALLCVVQSPDHADARTFVIPHVLDTSGRISSTTYTFDTTMFFTYSEGLAGAPTGSGATVDLYLFDQASGLPMRTGTGTVVCNPCSYTLDDGSGTGTPVRKVTVNVEELFGTGFPATGVVEGFAVIQTSGDEDNVNISCEIVNAHTGPFDLSVFGFEPQEISSARAYVIPHVFEHPGRVSITPFTFDTSMFITYTSGLAGRPPGAGATVGLYLFDDQGAPLTGASGVVCNPCTFQMGPSQRSIEVEMESLIDNAGGFGGAAVKLGFGIIVVGGANPEGINLQGFVVNSHTGPLDVSVFGFEPEPLRSALSVAVDETRPGESLELASFPNPASGDMQLSFALERTSHVSLEIFDASGRRITTVLDEVREAGRHTARWIPKDGSGARVPSGVYFGRLATALGSRISRLVYVP